MLSWLVGNGFYSIIDMIRLAVIPLVPSLLLATHYSRCCRQRPLPGEGGACHVLPSRLIPQLPPESPYPHMLGNACDS